MLGDLIAEELGQITGTRVLPSDTGAPRVEVSFSANGRVLGFDATDTATYISQARPDGTMFGEGQGILMTPDGDIVTWRGQGVGHFSAPGRLSWRGAVYYETSSERLARLNGLVGVFEYEVDLTSSKTESRLWEWK